MVGGVGGDVQVKTKKTQVNLKLSYQVWWLKACYNKDSCCCLSYSLDFSFLFPVVFFRSLTSMTRGSLSSAVCDIGWLSISSEPASHTLDVFSASAAPLGCTGTLCSRASWSHGTTRPSWALSAASAMTAISPIGCSASATRQNTRHDHSARLRRQLSIYVGSINRLVGASLTSVSGFTMPCGSTSTASG